MSKHNGLAFALGLFGLCIDQLTKYLALEQQVALLNSGIAFGLFAENNVVMIAVSLLVIVGLLIISWFYRQKIPIYLLAFAGISNVVDRLRFGAVIDWLPIPGTQITNNLADWIISASLLWLMVGYTQHYARNKHSV